MRHRSRTVAPPGKADRHPDAGLKQSLEHPFTLAYALFHIGFLHLWRREPEPMRDRAVGVLDVADEHDLEIWRALGTCLLGAAKTGLGRSEEGLTEIREGFARVSGPRRCSGRCFFSSGQERVPDPEDWPRDWA
jgi:hypothetical protein